MVTKIRDSLGEAVNNTDGVVRKSLVVPREPSGADTHSSRVMFKVRPFVHVATREQDMMTFGILRQNWRIK